MLGKGWLLISSIIQKSIITIKKNGAVVLHRFFIKKSVLSYAISTTGYILIAMQIYSDISFHSFPVLFYPLRYASIFSSGFAWIAVNESAICSTVLQENTAEVGNLLHVR